MVRLLIFSMTIKMNASIHTDNQYSIVAEFDKLADSYENNRLYRWYQASNRMLLKNFSKTGSVSILDIGCATGWLLRQAIKENLVRKGVGIDVSPQMISIATGAAQSENKSTLTFINADWEKFDIDILSNKKFDVVVCAHTFHYFRDPIRSLERILDCLSKGGKLYLIERDKTDSALTKLWEKVHKRILRNKVKFYSAVELQNMMIEAGYKNVCILQRVKRLFWKNKLYTSLVVLQANNDK